MPRCFLTLLQSLMLLMLPSLALAQSSPIACGTGCPDQVPVCGTDNICGPCVQDSQCKGGKVCDYEFGQCVDLSKAKYGGGCNTQGRRAQSTGTSSAAAGVFGALLVVFFSFALARRGRGRKAQLLSGGLLILAGSVMDVSEASAQSTEPPQTVTFNAQTFRPVVGPANVFTVDGTLIGRPRSFMGAVLFEYANRPLRLVLNDGTTFAQPVRLMATAHVMPGFTITNWLALSVDVPIVMYQAFDQRTPDSHVPNTPSVAGVGDVRLMTKFRIKNNENGGFGLAAIPQFQFPSGSAEDLRGDNTVGIEPRLAADYRFKNGIFIALNVGYYLRTYNRTVDFGLTRVADQLRYGLGIGLPIVKGFGFAGEVNGAASFYKFDGGNIYLPVEGYLAARYTHKSGFEVTAGGGAGFISAPGSPQYRAFLSLGYVPRAKPRQVDFEQTDDRKTVPVVTPVQTDADRDGIPVPADACPNEAGPAATKGCPDSDQDGVADREDKCKDLAGPVELGGCPDSDKDGIIDPNDKCPTQAGPPDKNGCPEQAQDQDKDGVLDAADKCPTQAGPADNAGCPDVDTDKDGVVDRLDKCPDKAGTAQSGGCPVIEFTETAIKLKQPIKFKAGTSKYEEGSEPVVAALAKAIVAEESVKKVKIQVTASGDKKAAKKLAKERAKALTVSLVDGGVAKKKLAIKPAKAPGSDEITEAELVKGKVKVKKEKKEKKPKEKKEKKEKKERKHRKKDKDK